MSNDLATFLKVLRGIELQTDAYGAFISLDALTTRVTKKGTCNVILRFQSDGHLALESSYAPMNAELRAMIRGHGGWVHMGKEGNAAFRISFTDREGHLVQDLAEAFRQVIAFKPGQRGYKDPNCRWKCPCIAEALMQLADVLDAYHKSQSLVADNVAPEPLTP